MQAVADADFRNEIVGLRRSTPIATLATNEAFWTSVAALYDRAEGFVQLDYGYYHPALRPVLDVELATAREVNRRGSHYKRMESSALLEAARADLASLTGMPADQIAIPRNASEALNIVINGLPLSRGDEVVCSDQDYGSMDEAWEQRALRDGVHIRRARLPLHPSCDDEVLASFEAEITPRTRVLHLTYLIHYTGQVLPIQALCALARRHGLEVIVDAAHAFAHIDFNINELDCDYFAASLHKWLGAPLGLGLLHVRADKIARLRPLFGDVRLEEHDIRRLEHFGNRPDSLYAGLREAILWHEAFGTPLKQARLRHLQSMWTTPARSFPRLRLLTPADPARHGALGAFAVEGRPPADVVQQLLTGYGLYAAERDHPMVGGVRITPGLPTSREDIERLIEALPHL